MFEAYMEYGEDLCYMNPEELYENFAESETEEQMDEY